MNALIRQNKTTTEEMTISRWEKSEPLGSGCGQLCAGRRCTTNDAPTQVVKLRQRRVTWTTGEPVFRYSIDNLSHADMSISACHMQTCQSVHVTCITRHLLSFTTAGYGSLLSQLHLVLVNSKIFFRLAYLTYSPLVSLLICKCYNTTIPSVLHLTVVVVSGMQL